VRESRPPGSVRGHSAMDVPTAIGPNGPQLVSSVTRITSTLRACANARTLPNTAQKAVPNNSQSDTGICHFQHCLA